tara:strand:- start:594 stop:830 length:237 start_codon:yes stop_codon:yes gene_type:complete
MVEFVMVRGQLKKNTPTELQPLKEFEYPYTADDVLEILQEAFPIQSPQSGEPHEHLMFRGGQRSVVDWLLHLKERSEQ